MGETKSDILLPSDDLFDKYQRVLADARRLRDALQQHMLVADIFPDWVAELIDSTAYLEAK